MKSFKWILMAIAAVACLQQSARASNVIDLTSAPGSPQSVTGSTGSAYVDTTGAHSTGTGVIGSFVQIQQTGSEQGFNTGTGSPLDDKNGHNFTFQLSQLQAVTLSVGPAGATYYEFLLDVNQTLKDPLLSLNQVQIFTSASAAPNSGYTLTNASNSADATLTFSGANLVFSMNNTTVNNEIWLNSGLNSGSGGGDMNLYVSTALFPDPTVGTNGSLYVTLFSQFGSPPGTYASNDGFEEWGALTNGTGGPLPHFTPVPSSVVMLGTCLPILGCFALIRRRLKARHAAA